MVPQRRHPSSLAAAAGAPAGKALAPREGHAGSRSILHAATNHGEASVLQCGRYRARPARRVPSNASGTTGAAHNVRFVRNVPYRPQRK
jgi:hypothetical protein